MSLQQIGGSIIHESNPNISSFLPPVSELPELLVDHALLRDDLNFISFLFEKIQGEYPDLDQNAIEFEDRNISFRQLIARSYGIANSLHSRGIKNGDRVLILVDFVSSSLESIFGTILTGAIACQDLAHAKDRVVNHLKNLAPKFVFVDVNLTNVAWVLENSETAFVVVTNPKSGLNLQDNARILFLEDFRQAASTFPHTLTKGGTIATMFHTSGSTGMPKGCVTTHASWVQILKEANQDPNCFSTLKKGDKFYPIPPTGAYSFICAVSVLYLGGSLVFSNLKDIPTVLSSLSKGVTWIAAIPPFYSKLRAFIKENKEQWQKYGASLRICICAGETHTANFAKEWKDVSGLDLINSYGSTEVLVCICSSPGAIVPGSMGKACRKVQAEILDSNYNVAPIDTPGFLAFKTYGGCIYWNNQEKQSYYVRDGWNIPRDICKKDKNGNFWFIGREDDLIITKSGGNVSALEIEGIIQKDSRVIEVAVVGKSVTGSREDGKLTLITAFVATNTNIDERATLEAELKSSVAFHSEFTLDQIEFINSLPKLPNGKINRKVLK
eukprot:Phypoly_transcript_05806.p1 GENE.Phypoly_transcript_05806~~Phypoly_transcript_05806.p1  ORF type:complete len:555 (+),score=77.91 Phypoly_transcript_05806:28-1692(+)